LDPTIRSMNILVLDRCNLISEMISMIIHRISPQANVVIANSFKNLCKLAHESENIFAVIIEPKSPGCFGFSGVAYLSKIIPKSELIILTDAQANFFRIEPHEKINFHLIEKSSSVIEVGHILERILSKDLLQRTITTTSPVILKLSKRHRQLLNLLSKGYSNAQISSELGITDHTVKVHFYRLFKILRVNNRLQALHYAQNRGWISNSD
jgi:DNA-binding NarL/FixJ family response regulator